MYYQCSILFVGLTTHVSEGLGLHILLVISASQTLQ